MGFLVEINSIIRSDEAYELRPGAVCSFAKSGSRVFFDNIPIWLTRMDWTALAEIRVLTQARDGHGVSGTFQVQHVYDVTVDPRDPKVLYASGFDQAAFRSTDRGESWTRLRGFNFKWGQRVIPDPKDASRIYVTTFGGSVWHGPAAGDPTATEDVAP